MKRKEPVSVIMTSEVSTVHVDQDISDVRNILEENPFHHIPVVTGRKIVGLISSSDMMKLSFALSYSNEPLDDETLNKRFTIEEVMHKDVYTINAKETTLRAAEMFCGGCFHSLLVVDEEDNLVGIVTSTDMVMLLLDQYRTKINWQNEIKAI